MSADGIFRSGESPLRLLGIDGLSAALEVSIRPLQTDLATRPLHSNTAILLQMMNENTNHPPQQQTPGAENPPSHPNAPAEPNESSRPIAPTGTEVQNADTQTPQQKQPEAPTNSTESESVGVGDDVLKVIQDVEGQLSRMRAAQKVQDDAVAEFTKRSTALKSGEEALAKKKQELDQQHQAIETGLREFQNRKQQFEQEKASIASTVESLKKREEELARQRQQVEALNSECMNQKEELTRQAQEFKSEHEDLLTKIEQSEAKAETFAKQIQAANQKLAESAKQNDESNTVLVESKRKLEELNQRFQATGQQLQDVSQKYEQANGQVEEIREQLEDSKKRFQVTNQQLEATTQKYEQVTQEAAESDKKLEELSAKFSQTNQRLEEAERKFEQSSQKVGALSQQLEGANKKYEDSCNRIDEAEKRLEDAQQRIEETKQKLSESYEKFDESNRRLNDTQQKLDETKQSAEATRQQLQESQEQFRESSEQLKETNKKLEGTTQKLADTTRQVEEKSAHLKKNAEEVVAFKKQISNFENKVQSAQDRIKEKESQLSETQRKLEFTSSKLAEFSKALSEQAPIIAQAGTSSALVEEQQKEIDRLTEKLAELNLRSDPEDVQRKDQRIKDLTDALRQARGQSGIGGDTVKKLEERNADLERQVDTLRLESENAKVTVEELKKKLSECANKAPVMGAPPEEVAEYKKTISSLTAEIERLNSQTVTKNRADFESMNKKHAEELKATKHAAEELNKALREKVAKLEEVLKDAQSNPAGTSADHAQATQKLRAKAERVSAVSEHLRRRKKRLDRVRELQRKKKKGKDAAGVQMRAEQMFKIQEERASLTELRKMLESSESTMQRQWARPKAITTVAGVAFIVFVCAIASWFAADVFFPAERSASTVIEAKDKSLSPEYAESWRAWHINLLKDLRFQKTVATRMAERRLDTYADPSMVGHRISTDLTIDPSPNAVLTLTLAGTDKHDTLMFLDVLTTALLAESYRQLDKRSDNSRAVAMTQRHDGGSIQYAMMNPVPISDLRLIYAGPIFGVLFAISMVFMIVVYKRLMRAKRVFDSENAGLFENARISTA